MVYPFKSTNMNVVTWLRILFASLKRNGPLQLFFYLSNLDASRFIEYSKATDFLEKEESGFVLDLGAGYSIFPSFMQRELLCRNCEYVTLDLSMNACRFQAEEKRSNTHQIRCDMAHLPIKSISTRCALAISSIEHVPEDVMVFQEVSRILSDGGTAIISVPYSRKGAKTTKIRHSKRLLFLLQKYSGLWSILLNKHLNYFIEQTATDSIMKYYDDNSINELLTRHDLAIQESYRYGGLVSKFFRHVPTGWLVLKELFTGFILVMIDQKQSNAINEGGIIFPLKTSV